MARSNPDASNPLLKRKERLTHEVRGKCQLLYGVLAASRAPDGNDHFTEQAEVIEHALDHDSIGSTWREPKQGQLHDDSHRIFTDGMNEVGFACAQAHMSVYDHTRDKEIFMLSADTQHIL